MGWRKRTGWDVPVIVSISISVWMGGSSFLFELPESIAEKTFVHERPLDQDNPLNEENAQPDFPPMRDSEMVVKPEIPPDPEAVITPPIIDPEMAVDPATGQHLSEEKLERLTPESLEKDMSDSGNPLEK